MSLVDRIGLRRWRHVVKLDPDKSLSPMMVRRIAGSGTDAVLVGGTQRITRAKILSLLWHLRQAPVPVVMEVSDEACAVPGADAYFVPIILNTDNPEWYIRRHVQGLRRLGHLVPWHLVLVEGYIIGNPESAVARRVGVEVAPPAADVQALVQYGAGLLRLPIIYLEYSGRLADTDLVSRAASALRRVSSSTDGVGRLFYGGGIADYSAASTMLSQVDTIVVGNALYRPQGQEALEATLAAAKSPGIDQG